MLLLVCNFKLGPSVPVVSKSTVVLEASTYLPPICTVAFKLAPVLPIRNRPFESMRALSVPLVSSPSVSAAGILIPASFVFVPWKNSITCP